MLGIIILVSLVILIIGYVAWETGVFKGIEFGEFTFVGIFETTEKDEIEDEEEGKKPDPTVMILNNPIFTEASEPKKEEPEEVKKEESEVPKKRGRKPGKNYKQGGKKKSSTKKDKGNDLLLS